VAPLGILSAFTIIAKKIHFTQWNPSHGAALSHRKYGEHHSTSRF
jgi:hypothetical protein